MLAKEEFHSIAEIIGQEVCLLLEEFKSEHHSSADMLVRSLDFTWKNWNNEGEESNGGTLKLAKQVIGPFLKFVKAYMYKYTD